MHSVHSYSGPFDRVARSESPEGVADGSSLSRHTVSAERWDERCPHAREHTVLDGTVGQGVPRPLWAH